jgi:hypothetical protein
MVFVPVTTALTTTVTDLPTWTISSVSALSTMMKAHFPRAFQGTITAPTVIENVRSMETAVEATMQFVAIRLMRAKT